MTFIVAVLLAAALGWVWGHSCARIKVVPVGATADQDADALDDACCEVWWTSAGTAHTDGCDRARWTA
ncbi:hypothetical protein [Streptomyces sp. NPDC088785]|uniref:hypothetical protein n=1 Tax=Streptomyces sp. NPDC088785 TaxID=3365897 RepID=UPI0038097A68